MGLGSSENVGGRWAKEQDSVGECQTAGGSRGWELRLEEKGFVKEWRKLEETNRNNKI